MFLEPKELVNKEAPFINEPYIPSVGGNVYSSRAISTKSLMKAIKGTPECMGILRTIANDIVTHISFKAISENKKKKSKTEERANEFAKKNFFKQELFTSVIDWLGTGDFYLWVGKVSNALIKKLSKNKFVLNDIIDEDYNGINAIRSVPASTITIDYDETKIKGFQQMVNTKKRYWQPDEIIHGMFMKLDGKVYGYSPTEACYDVMVTLGLIKDYAGYFFDSGGTPDNVFSFPIEMAESPYLKKFEQQLETYQNTKKRGSLVSAGLNKVDRINEFNKDIEFRKLAIYYTGIIAFAWGLPLGKIQAILASDIRATATSGATEDSGYWRNIEEAQDYLEILINSQFWNPYFNVNMGVRRKYHQDKVRITQGRVQAAALMEIMLKYDYPVTDEFFHEILDIPREFLKEGEINREIEQQKQPPFMPNKKIFPEEGEQAKAEKKKAEAKTSEEEEGGKLGA